MNLGQGSLVSVIIPTRNAAQYLERCLKSVRSQTYDGIEIIVVDNASVDGTIEIARRYADKILAAGPERSAQVNFGVKHARGRYIYKVDADFELDPRVVEQCVSAVQEGSDAVVVHNSPDSRISWIAKLRKFEVDMYKYDLTHSSARFLKKEVFDRAGGFNEQITAGEDYDFQNRLNRLGCKTGFIQAEALHLGEPSHLWPHLKKYFAYGKDFRHYMKENQAERVRQLGFFRAVYLRNIGRFVRHPVLGTGFAVYHVLKYASGFLGYLTGRIQGWMFEKTAR